MKVGGERVDILERQLVGNQWRYLIRTEAGVSGWCDYYYLDDVRKP